MSVSCVLLGLVWWCCLGSNWHRRRPPVRWTKGERQWDGLMNLRVFQVNLTLLTSLSQQRCLLGLKLVRPMATYCVHTGSYKCTPLYLWSVRVWVALGPSAHVAWLHHLFFTCASLGISWGSIGPRRGPCLFLSHFLWNLAPCTKKRSYYGLILQPTSNYCLHPTVFLFLVLIYYDDF